MGLVTLTKGQAVPSTLHEATFGINKVNFAFASAVFERYANVTHITSNVCIHGII